MPIGSLRVTNNETLYELAENLFGKVTRKLNIMTSGPDARFPDDVVLTGSPDDMIFNGKKKPKKTLFTYSVFHKKIFSLIAGVKSPILQATYAYLTEVDGLLYDISSILADIILDIVHDMLDETKILHRIYLLLDEATKTAIQLANQLPIETLTLLLNGQLAGAVNVTAIIGKPAALMASMF